MSFNPPPLPPMQPAWGQFQVWWQAVISDLQAVLGPLLDLNNDDLLTPSKKPLWIFMYDYLTGEQAGLDAQATTLGITTEKTNYDTAVSTLIAYMATLTTPVVWTDLSGNTDVVGVTMRADFNDVMIKKQALINAMQTASSGGAAAALAAANAAQATADTVKRDDSISSSWTVPGSILTASDAGSDATITVAAHTRAYSDVSSVSVNTGTVTGLAYSTTYYVYYDQTSKAGGAVTYHADIYASTAMAGRAAGRHYCGAVTTPAAAAPPTTGGVAPPGGGGNLHDYDISNHY